MDPRKRKFRSVRTHHFLPLKIPKSLLTPPTHERIPKTKRNTIIIIFQNSKQKTGEPTGLNLGWNLANHTDQWIAPNSSERRKVTENFHKTWICKEFHRFTSGFFWEVMVVLFTVCLVAGGVGWIHRKPGWYTYIRYISSKPLADRICKMN